MRRMRRSERYFSKVLFFFFGFFVIVKYLRSQNQLEREGNVVNVDRKTWQILTIQLKSNEKVKTIGKSREEKNAQDHNVLMKNEFKETHKPNIKRESNSRGGKEERLLEILKHPHHLKSDPSAPKDSSRLVVENEIREPLDDREPVLLVWWPPEYLVAKKGVNDLFEREFQGVCGKCRLTTDRRLLTRSNVVLFDNIPMKSKIQDLPPVESRRPEQAYVLWHRETPAKIYHLKHNMIGTFDKMFNYTLSYRRDADIRWYLGNAEFARRSLPAAHHKNPQRFIDKVMASKRHLAVWIVSNCNNTRGAIARMKYAQQLVVAGLKLNRFGKCFNKLVPRKKLGDFLISYKFYLAFENSWHCKDYVTEKFWRNGLMSNVVPVVWGPSREDVAAIAPAHSYIHSEDFESPEALVNYLNYLDGNDTAYQEYFKWRLEPVSLDVPVNMLRTGYETAMCKMCRVLNENNGVLPYKVLTSSVDWVFIEGDNSKCLLYDLNK